MPAKLSSSAQRFQDELTGRGLSHQVIEFEQTTRTSAEAAEAVGCQVAQIAKSLIFRGKRSGRPVLVIASGANRVDEKAVKKLIEEKIGKADADFVREKTGYVIGGVPPLGHVEEAICLIDEDLLEHALIWAAAGTPRAVFQLTPDELVAMTGGQVARVKQLPKGD